MFISEININNKLPISLNTKKQICLAYSDLFLALISEKKVEYNFTHFKGTSINSKLLKT